MEKFMLNQLVADFNSDNEEKKKNAETEFLDLGKRWINGCKKTAKLFGNINWMCKRFAENNGKLKNVLVADQKHVVFYGSYKDVDYDTGHRDASCVQYISLKMEHFYDNAPELFKESCRLAAIMKLESSIKEYKRQIADAQKQIEKIKKIK